MNKKSLFIVITAPFFYLISYIPFFILYGISDFFFVLMYYVVGYRKKIVRKNLTNSFPDKSIKEIISIEKKFYRHLCDYGIETIKTLTISKKNIQKRYRFKNPDLIQKYYDQGKSIIIYSGHYGNWEWFSVLAFYSNYKMCAVYQPQAVKIIDHMTRLCRERFGATTIKSANAFRELLSYSKQGIQTAALVLGDLRPFPSSTRYWIKFLNQETAFSIGADRIAMKLNKVVIFPKIKKLKRGYYEVEFQVITDNIESIDSNNVIEIFASQLESLIKQEPPFWLWSHNRWKQKKPLS
ncbi:MAG: lysophospholipid acyltransferase family protein [Marinilabiliaceae bacterium]|nr:lysophospholipid acyltransferase family protein [Marinilabiliaceae bacterium]